VNDTLVWSEKMDGLFRKHVHEIVEDHPKTDWGENIRLGYPFGVIRDDVLKKGRADFAVGHADAQYGNLTADQKVLLYCFVNMKGHFFSSYANFRFNKMSLIKHFGPPQRIRVYDIGCGPATALLALCDLFPGIKLRYYGIDRAQAMPKRPRSCGMPLSNSALSAGSRLRYSESLGIRLTSR